MFRKSPWRIFKSKRTFFLITAVGFLFKYWLVLGDEIEPFYRPADDLNYVLLAKSWYWWAEYNAYSFLRAPIFPLFLGIVNFTEIPLRIVQELLLCGGAFFLVNRFRKNGINATIAGATYVVTILHPGWLLLANRTLRECFYASLLMIFIALLIPLTNRKLNAVKWYQLLPVGLTAALLWHTREESIWIAGLLAGFVLIFWILKQEFLSIRKTAKQLGWVCLGLLGPILIINLTIRSANYAAHGLFIQHEFAGVSFSKLQKRLMQIKPANQKTWVSVEQESLEKAYAVSPTLNSIREALSNRVGPRWAAATVGRTNDSTEIAGSAFFFALREAAMEEGIHSDPITAHKFYSKIDAELKQAFKTGKLEKQFVLTSYIDPNYSDFLSRLPEGLLNVGGFAFRPLSDNDIRIYYPRHNVFQTLDVFDEVTNRRHHLSYRKVHSIRGWAFLEGKEVTSIQVVDHSGVFLDSTSIITDRPDVEAAYEGHSPPLKSGFEISLPKADYPNWNVNVVFHTKEGETAAVPASRLLKIGQEQVHGNEGTLLRVTVDELRSGKDDFATQDAIQAWLWLNHGKFHLFFGGTALIVLLVRYALFKSVKNTRHYYRWICFVVLVIVSRWLMITLMDVSSFRISLRYIFPALIFLPLLFALILQEALAGFKANRLRW